MLMEELGNREARDADNRVEIGHVAFDEGKGGAPYPTNEVTAAVLRRKLMSKTAYALSTIVHRRAFKERG